MLDPVPGKMYGTKTLPNSSNFLPTQLDTWLTMVQKTSNPNTFNGEPHLTFESSYSNAQYVALQL